MTAPQTGSRPARAEFVAMLTALNTATGPDRLRPLFGETFMNLSPGHAGPVPREAFLQHALPAREAMFRSVHATGFELLDCSERTLDDDHVWIEGRWRVRFEPDTRAAELTLASAFLLQRRSEGWQIVVYLNHHDVAAEIAARAGKTS